MTQTLREVLSSYSKGPRPLPAGSECAGCGYFDTGYPGFAEALAERDPDGRRGLLMAARCRCRRNAQAERDLEELRWSESNIPPGMRTLETFRPRSGTAEMLQAARDFISGMGPPVLVLWGGCGAGKSHLLEAIGRAWLEKGRRARYEVGGSFVDRLRATYRDDREELSEVTKWYQGFSLLLLDDLGVERSTPFATEQLTRLVDGRISKARATVVATNLSRDEMAEHMGDRIASRLYAGNPDLGEVRNVRTTASDFRR